MSSSSDRLSLNRRLWSLRVRPDGLSAEAALRPVWGSGWWTFGLVPAKMDSAPFNLFGAGGGGCLGGGQGPQGVVCWWEGPPPPPTAGRCIFRQVNCLGGRGPVGKHSPVLSSRVWHFLLGIASSLRMEESPVGDVLLTLPLSASVVVWRLWERLQWLLWVGMGIWNEPPLFVGVLWSKYCHHGRGDGQHLV